MMGLRLYRPLVGFDNEARKLHDFMYGKGDDNRVTIGVTKRFLTQIYLSCRLLLGDDIDVCSDVIDALRDFDTNVTRREIINTIKQYCGLRFGYPNGIKRPLYVYWCVIDLEKYICRFKDNMNVIQHKFHYWHLNPNIHLLLYTNADTGEALVVSTALPYVTFEHPKTELHVYTKRTNTHTHGEWLVKKFGTVRGEKNTLLNEDIVKVRGYIDEQTQ